MGLVRLTVSARTDPGQARDRNEDAFLIADLTTGTIRPPDEGQHLVGRRGCLFIVADGMGGAASGELASAMAADTIFDQLKTTWTSDLTARTDEFDYRILGAVETANTEIHRFAATHPESRGMGTTATVVALLGTRLHLAQVGDSRAYLVRNGQLFQLTRDQSLIQRLIDVGEITEEEAARSDRRNIILQALGPDAAVRVDLSYQDVSRGDTLIICSDGLSTQVTGEEMAAIVAESQDVSEISSRLVALANQRGGPDNITTIVVRFDGEGLSEPGETSKVGYHPQALAEEHPPTGDDEVQLTYAQPVSTTRRAASPAVVAAIGGLVLLLLLAVYRLLS